jgi:twitching motility protein PilT
MSDPAASAPGVGAPAATISPTTDPLKLLGQVLAFAVKLKASDIHLRTRNHPILRVDGNLRAMREIPVMPADFMERLARTMMSARLQSQFEKDHQVDLSIGFKDIGRVRANVFYQRGSIGMVLRVINSNVPQPADLNLPDIVTSFTRLERGLILVTGATGSGKSTTLASLINEINNTRSDHVVTIEDPIEFLFTEKKSIITQREVGIDTNTFADAMRAVLREDPDVILLGEMRDPETIEAALTAAETGHVVYSTVHSPGAAETISRLVTSFAAEAQPGIRAKIAQNLKGVISQRLLPRKNGQGRTIACEVMTVSQLARELILDPLRIKDLADLIKKGTIAEGMMSFDSSLFMRFKQGEIDEETAIQYANSPTDLKLKIDGFA